MSTSETCEDCTHARVCMEFHWTRYDCFACVWCCARLIQSLAKLPIGATAMTQRRKALITEAAARGQDEALIRKLAAGPLALQPPPEKKEKKK